MDRITLKQLEGLAGMINRELGTPEAAYTKGADGKYTANIGCHHLDGAYGGHKLVRMVNDGGGVSDVTGGYIPKRELYNRMRAYLDGVRARVDLSRTI